jgi:hypothetical protein
MAECIELWEAREARHHLARDAGGASKVVGGAGPGGNLAARHQ